MDKMQVYGDQPMMAADFSNPSFTSHHLRKKSDKFSKDASSSRYSDIDKRFDLQKLLGEGAYGKVYKALDKNTNKVSIILMSKHTF